MDAERHLPLAGSFQPRYATVWTVCRPDVTVLVDWASTPRYLLWTICLGLVFAGPSCPSALDWTLELKNNCPPPLPSFSTSPAQEVCEVSP